ncbi:hypothetical protein [Tsuneonella troitsensis]|uniref:hypothetical protein n=2 Tax=Tsuneonella troitsensis TaxID=292222 RepID=UPI000AA1ED13|nr:hypothetical protein [Tsuneonella troitsensis]
MTDCPKCRGRMTQGYLFLPDTGGRIKWMDGAPGFWKSMMGIGAKSAELTCKRCGSCGFVEFYVDTDAKPVKTLKAIDDENERLRNLVTRLQERVATLETIATDPAERTARAIEDLRSAPDD